MWQWLQSLFAQPDFSEKPAALQQTPGVIMQQLVPLPGVGMRFDEMMALQDSWDRIPGMRGDSSATYNPLTGLGGGGDKGSAARPNVNWVPLSDGERRIQFRRSGLTRRMCWIYGAQSFRKGFTIEVADIADKPKAQQVQKDAEALGFNNVATMAGMFANRDGCHLLVSVLEERPNAIDRLTGLPAIDLALPPSKIDKVVALQAFERIQCSVAAWDWDFLSKSYFKPRVWALYPSMGSSPLYVHASRVLWFRGSELSPMDLYANAGFDDSLIDTAWDELRNKLQIGQIGATVAAELSVKVLQIAGKAGASSEDQARTFMGRLSMWWRSMSVGNIGVIGAEDKVSQAGSTVTGFAELTEEAWTALAAITDIPRTVLTGEPPGGLNADGQAQRENWNAAVRSRQINKFEPLVRQLFGWLFEAAGGAPKEWSVDWNPLDQPTEREVAEIYAMYAEADSKYLDKGVVLPSTVAQSRFGGAVFGTEITLTPQDITQAKSLGNLALAAQKLLEKNAEAQGAGSPGTGGGPRETPGGESKRPGN